MKTEPNISVLVVDANATVLNMYKAMLESWQKPEFHVMQATNGKQALEMMEIHPFAVIITDFDIPLANGQEVIKKALELYPDALIILNSSGLPEGLQDTLDWIIEEQHPVVYKAKPLQNPHHIGSLVDQLLKEKEAKKMAQG